MIKIVPYTEQDGIRNLSDSFIASLYERLIGEGYGKDLFFDKNARCAADFVAQMKRLNKFFIVVTEVGAILGVFWLNHIENRTCQIHIACFKEFYGDDCVKAGKLVLDMLLHSKASDGDFVFDCLLGVIPVRNALARKFALATGMRKAGVIPNMLFDAYVGKSIDACIYYLTREVE